MDDSLSPEVLLLGAQALDSFQSVLTSLDVLISQEEESFRLLTARIMQLQPQLVVCEGCVPRAAEEILIRAGVILLQEVSGENMLFLSRICGCPVIPSLNYLDIFKKKIVGSLFGGFRVREVPVAEAEPARGRRSSSAGGASWRTKSLCIFETGAPAVPPPNGTSTTSSIGTTTAPPESSSKSRGLTVCLTHEDPALLPTLEKILRYAIRLAVALYREADALREFGVSVSRGPFSETSPAVGHLLPAFTPNLVYEWDLARRLQTVVFVVALDSFRLTDGPWSLSLSQYTGALMRSRLALLAELLRHHDAWESLFTTSGGPGSTTEGDDQQVVRDVQQQQDEGEHQQVPVGGRKWCYHTTKLGP